jgi:hypothetical protein
MIPIHEAFNQLSISAIPIHEAFNQLSISASMSYNPGTSTPRKDVAATGTVESSPPMSNPAASHPIIPSSPAFNSSGAAFAQPARISLSEYSAWKASGLKTYTEYLVWRKDHPHLEPLKLPRMQVDRAYERGIEIEQEIERKKKEEIKNKRNYRHGLWGTQWV